MAFIEVKNKNGTSDNSAPTGYSSWLDFWEKKKGQKATVCEVLGCRGSADLGGHVYKVGETAKEYIVPMCYGCNNKPDGEIFQVWDNDLVPVT